MPDRSDQTEPHLEPDILLYSVPPRLKLAGIVALCVAALIVVVGLTIRFYSSAKTETWTHDEAVQTVQTIKLRDAKKGGDLILSGDVEAFTNAPIYAQVSGYVKKWYADIGTPVKAGDLLAEIDPRPFQATLDQAKGQLAKDQATLTGAQADLKRYQALMAVNAESQQTLEDEAALVATDIGIVQSDKANVETAQINLGYTRIIAPFDGIVTSRSVDVGTESVAPAGSTAAIPLFTVTDEKKLRIYVHLPQVYSTLIRPGLIANFTVPDYPGRNFTAQLTASADAVSSQSGTQLIQFQIDNSDRALKPGDYAEMHLVLPASSSIIRVPSTALLFRDAGMMVATVDSSNHVVLKKVTIRTDLGPVVEVGSGLLISDRVIDNPPDSLQAGELVHVIAEPNRPDPD